MRPLADALAEAGFAVEMPRLPGHGTSVDDMVHTTFEDWLGEAERALGTLRDRIPDGKVVVAGLSMGGALTCALAERHQDLAGIVVINAPMAVPEEMLVGVQQMLEAGAEMIDSIGGDIADPDADEASYDQTPLRPLRSLIETEPSVRGRLGEITCPALIITSRQDHVVNPGDSDLIAAAVSGPVERLWLEKSFHVATLDYDKAEVQSATVDFARRVTAG
jgi:carboxylesterase